MAKIHDIMKNLKELEERAIKHITENIYQIYLSQSDRATVESEYLYKFSAEYETYLYDCLSRFIAYIENIDSSYYVSNNSAFWIESVDQADIVNRVVAAAAKAAASTPNDINAIRTAATAAVADNLDSNIVVQKIGLLDKINPVKTRKVDDILYFKYISDMLNLNDEYICKLLPYLLTAYVCSAGHNRFFRKGKSALADIFGNLDCGEQSILHRDARRKAQIEILSKCFSFIGYAPKNKEQHKTHSKKKPIPCVVDRSNPYRDVAFAEPVFESFAAIVYDSAECKGNEVQKAVRKIDLKSCYFLLLSYICPTELYKLSDTAVSNYWNDAEYNERLLAMFHSRYKHRYF